MPGNLVSGAELPPKEDPFRELGGADSTRQNGWRARLPFVLVAAGVLALVAYGAGLAWLAAWVGQR